MPAAHLHYPHNLPALSRLVQLSIANFGPTADLNHINTSQIRDMSGLFAGMDFRGDVSGWDTSNVTNMNRMFSDCTFDGDISMWNVCKLKDMACMFLSSPFNGDISRWKPVRVNHALLSFARSSFCGDLQSWWHYNPSLKSSLPRMFAESHDSYLAIREAIDSKAVCEHILTSNDLDHPPVRRHGAKIL